MDEITDGKLVTNGLEHFLSSYCLKIKIWNWKYIKIDVVTSIDLYFKKWYDDSDIGEIVMLMTFLMVTDLRYWWQKHYVGNFSPTSQTCHQHIWSSISVTNINGINGINELNILYRRWVINLNITSWCDSNYLNYICYHHKTELL